MLDMTKPMRIAAVYAAPTTCGLVSSPVFAALSLSDVDWNSFLQFNSVDAWRSWLLVGSIALLIVGLMFKAIRPDDSAEPRNRVAGDRYTRRIGTMPIYPPDYLDPRAV